MPTPGATEPHEGNTPDPAAADRVGPLLEVHLSKYNSLRAEVFHRFQFQQQTVNFLLVALAAVAAAAASFRADHPDLIAALILIVPLVAGPLGYIYLANELMIFGILGYIRRELSGEVSRLLGQPVTLADGRFDHLLSASRQAQGLLPHGRWLLFLLPTVGSVLYVALFTALWRTPPFAIVWIADVLLAAALIGAVVATTREEASWRHSDGGKTGACRSD